MVIIKKRLVKHLGATCLGPTIEVKKIEYLRHKINRDHKLKISAKFFSILAGKIRLKILYLLQNERELCVCDITDILKANISAVSHQLKILRDFGLVKSRREAQTIFYSLSEKSRRELSNHFKNKL